VVILGRSYERGKKTVFLLPEVPLYKEKKRKGEPCTL
jgi:hypothetical protein